MASKYLFLFDIDDTILETSDFIINKYNEIVASGEFKGQKLEHDDFLMLDDFIYWGGKDLIPIYPEIFDYAVKEAMLRPHQIGLVKGINKFFKKYVCGHDLYIISCRQYLSPIETELSYRLYYPNKLNIILVEDIERKSLLINEIGLTSEDKYDKIFLFDDNLEFEYLNLIYNMDIFIRKRPWNKNIFTDYECHYPLRKYFSDYNQLVDYFDLHRIEINFNKGMK